MKYLLDTNIVIFYFKKKFGLFDKLRKASFDNCLISEITLAELRFGAEHSSNQAKHRQEIEDFIKVISVIPITSAIEVFAKEKSRLYKAGTPCR